MNIAWACSKNTAKRADLEALHLCQCPRPIGWQDHCTILIILLWKTKENIEENKCHGRKSVRYVVLRRQLREVTFLSTTLPVVTAGFQRDLFTIGFYPVIKLLMHRWALLIHCIIMHIIRTAVITSSQCSMRFADVVVDSTRRRRTSRYLRTESLNLPVTSGSSSTLTSTTAFSC